jgi:hypothetical protein
MMKKMTTLLLVLAIGGMAKAQNYQTAIGIRFSSNDAAINNSITVKHFLSGTTAIEGLLSFGDPFAIGALVELHNGIESVNGLQWFYGGGAYVGFGGRRNVGAQGVLGLDYKFNNLPINLSIDWKPELNLIRQLSFEPAAVGLSARFTFQ